MYSSKQMSGCINAGLKYKNRKCTQFKEKIWTKPDSWVTETEKGGLYGVVVRSES